MTRRIAQTCLAVALAVSCCHGGLLSAQVPPYNSNQQIGPQSRGPYAPPAAWQAGPGHPISSPPRAALTGWEMTQPAMVPLAPNVPVAGPPQIYGPYQPQVPTGPPQFYPQPTPAAQVAAPPDTPVESAQIMAWVGDEFILAGEVYGTVDQIMAANRDQIPEGAWKAQRQMLAREALKRLIENKLILVDAKRHLPPDALPDIEKRVNESFEEDYIKNLMKQTKSNSRAELERKLVEAGSSIASQRRTYFERSLGAYWVGQQNRDDAPVSYDEMYEYYREHLDDYSNPAKARWEELSVDFSRYPNPDAARAAIAEMGNDVILKRMPLADVARGKSHGPTASEGGVYDWTTKGALKSKEVDEALFSLPLNVLSTIIADDSGFRIIRVTERVPANRTAFRDAQVEIEKKIRQERRKKKTQEYYKELSKDVRIWTIFDDQDAAQRPIP